MSRACARTGSGGPWIGTAESVADPGCGATIRSTRSFQTATRCSTATRVAPVFSRQRPTASRTSRTPGGSRLAVGLVERRGPGRIPRMPASAGRASARRRAPTSGGPAAAVPARRRRALRPRGPDLGPGGTGEVFRAERDVVAEAREHHLSLRVLLHQPGTAAPGPGAGRRGSGCPVSSVSSAVPPPALSAPSRSCHRAPRPGRGGAWTCRHRKVPGSGTAPRRGCPGPVR